MRVILVPHFSILVLFIVILSDILLPYIWHFSKVLFLKDSAMLFPHSEVYSEPCQNILDGAFCENKRLKIVHYFPEKLHLKCLTGFWICLFHFSFTSFTQPTSITNDIMLAIHYVAVPVGIYLLKVNNRKTRIRCEIYSKLTVGVVLISLLLTLNIFHTFF